MAIFRSSQTNSAYPCVSVSGHHVGCGGNGDRIFRHNSIRDAVFSAAQSAALASSRCKLGSAPLSQEGVAPR